MTFICQRQFLFLGQSCAMSGQHTPNNVLLAICLQDTIQAMLIHKTKILSICYSKFKVAQAKLKPCVTFIAFKFTTANGDCSTELSKPSSSV